MGAAPIIPVELWLSGVLLGLPIHTAVASLGVKPTVQLSRKSCVVPVLAATRRPGSVRSPWQPNDMQRLRSSDMIDPMMYATCGVTARDSFVEGSYVYLTRPRPSWIFRMAAGRCRTPRVARVDTPVAISRTRTP